MQQQLLHAIKVHFILFASYVPFSSPQSVLKIFGCKFNQREQPSSLKSLSELHLAPSLPTLFGPHKSLPKAPPKLVMLNARTRGNRSKLGHRRHQLNIRKCCTEQGQSSGTGCLHRLQGLLPCNLPRLTGCCPGQRALGDPCLTRGWSRWPPEVPLHPNHDGAL